MTEKFPEPKITQIAFNLSPKVGGPYASILSMHLALFEQNKLSELIFSSPDQSTEHFLNSQKLGKMRVFFYKGNLIRGISPKFAFQILKSVKTADWIHIHGYYSLTCLYSAYLCLFYNKPFSLQPHGSLDKWDQRKHRKLKFILNHSLWLPLRKHCKVLVLTSQQEKNDISDGFFSNTKFLVVSYGLPNDQIYQKQDPNLLNGIDDSKFNVLFMGRITKKKRLDLVSKIVGGARVQGLPAHLLVVGPIEEDCLDIVNDVNDQLENNVTFVGPIYDAELKRKLFQYSSVLLLPSESENFGLVILESMKAKVPILTSSHVGATEGFCVSCSNLHVIDKEDLSYWVDLLVKIKSNDVDDVKICEESCNSHKYHKLWQNLVNLYRDKIKEVLQE